MECKETTPDVMGNRARHQRNGENMRYRVVIRKTDEGYSVCCPGLPGCWSQGDTEAEALENIRDAIQEYLAAVYESTRDAETREIEIEAPV